MRHPAKSAATQLLAITSLLVAAFPCAVLRGQASKTNATAKVTASVTTARLDEILAGDTPATVAELRAMQTHVQQLIKKVLPATVSLPGASGVLVQRDGVTFVLSAAHVTMMADQPINIRQHDDRLLRGTSLGANHQSDVSLVRVDTAGEHPFVPIGKSSALKRGQWVLMLGHPSGRKAGRAAPARLGRVLRNPATGYLVSDCTMQAGDSGGPLFDMQGRVVGINSRISRNLANNMHAPIDALVAQWTELQEGKVTQARRRGRRARLGFGATLQYGEGCPVFGDVTKDSAAAKAGLKTGDRLFEIDGIEIDTRRSVMRVLRELRAGDRVDIVVERAGKGVELTLPVVAGEAR